MEIKYDFRFGISELKLYSGATITVTRGGQTTVYNTKQAKTVAVTKTLCASLILPGKNGDALCRTL